MVYDYPYLPETLPVTQAPFPEWRQSSTSPAPFAPAQTLMSIVTDAAAVHAYPSATHVLHAGPAPTTWEMSAAKGAFVEDLMGHLVTSGHLRATGAWTECSPGRVGATGIDGLFVRTDALGRPRSLLVAEAKYGTSRFGMTASGKQMSPGWISTRLELVRCARPPRLGADAIRVPLKAGQFARVWEHSGKLQYFSAKRPVSVSEIALQVRRTRAFLSGAAEGRIAYRSRLFRFAPIGREFLLESVRLDPATGQPIGSRELIQATFDRLPLTSQRAVTRSLERRFVALGKTKREARDLAREVCENPEYLQQMRRDPRWSWKAGLDRKLVWSGLSGAAIGFGFDVVSQYLTTRNVDLVRASKVGAIGAVSAVVGHYVGVQAGSLVATTAIGQSIDSLLPLGSIGGFSPSAIVGAAGGGIVAGAVFSYGMWLLGLCDARTANTQMLASGLGTLAGAGATAGTLGVVGAFGTAGTGTAISSLSGAAATNAAVAWVGGGTIASGGGGIAAGAAILTGGAVAVALAVSASVGFAFHLLNKRERRFLLEGRLSLVAGRVARGAQAEWAEA